MKKFISALLGLVLTVTLIGGCNLTQDETQRYAYLDKQEITATGQASFNEEEIPAASKDISTQIVGLWRLETVTIDDDDENFICYGSAYDIKADGTVTNYFFFEPTYNQISWTMSENSIITLDSPSQNEKTQLFLETRDDKDYMVLDSGNKISEYYQTSKDEFASDKENATKNDSKYAAQLIATTWISQPHTKQTDDKNEYSFIFYPDSTFKRIYKDGFPYYGKWEIKCGMLNLYYDNANMDSLNLPIEIEKKAAEELVLKLYGTIKENECEYLQYVSSKQPTFSAEDIIGFWHAVFANNIEIVDDGQAYEFKDDGTIIMYGSFEPYDTGMVEWELFNNELISFSFKEGESALKVSLLEHEENSYLHFYNGDVEWIFFRSSYEEFKESLNSN